LARGIAIQIQYQGKPNAISETLHKYLKQQQKNDFERIAIDALSLSLKRKKGIDFVYNPDLPEWKE